MKEKNLLRPTILSGTLMSSLVTGPKGRPPNPWMPAAAVAATLAATACACAAAADKAAGELAVAGFLDSGWSGEKYSSVNRNKNYHYREDATILSFT